MYSKSVDMFSLAGLETLPTPERSSHRFQLLENVPKSA